MVARIECSLLRPTTRSLYDNTKRKYKYIYVHFFFLGFGQEVFSGSASVCDSRKKWKSRSNSFVRASSSGGGSNAPRPAESVPHLGGIGYVCSWGGIRPSYSWILACAEFERKKRSGKHSFQVRTISKLAPYFVPTPLSSWSHLEAFGLLCTSYD